MSVRRLVILTDGHSDPITAKTAVCLMRYCPEEVIGILDRQRAGQRASQVFGIGGDTPVIGSLADASSPTALVIGIAPSGGRVPREWRPIIQQALGKGLDVISGLHEFLGDDAEFAAAARGSGARIHDVRRNQENDVASGRNIREDCLRLLTVGQDCSVGKMVVAVELARALRAKDQDAHFIATGQTGIMVSGEGCPVDRVISDFLAGAVEKMLLAQQHHGILLFEGQGSISHPKYSAVTLGLLHGCRPQGMILCYEAGRTAVHGMDWVPLRPLDQLVSVYEMAAGLVAPGKVIAVAANTRQLSPAAASEEMDKVGAALHLPVFDVVRDGCGGLAEAVLARKAELLELGRSSL